MAGWNISLRGRKAHLVNLGRWFSVAGPFRLSLELISHQTLIDFSCHSLDKLWGWVKV
jgi:hypothetical protein